LTRREPQALLDRPHRSSILSTPNDYRPQLHFSPREGWINDPNGLIYVEGVYHLFYQHNPHATVHGPMHWGHATSRDLAHWDEQPIALYPGPEGECFSGSAVSASEGEVAPELREKQLLFYTGHQKTADGKDFQSQCLALADHTLTRFDKFACNPVVPNNGLEAFRDPKVIWHVPTRRWIMVATHGQSIGFYTSADAVSWRFESAFGEHAGRHSDGPWECPDLFPLRLDETGEEFWILVVGIGRGGFADGSGTQYFIGRFDGRSFANINPPDVELWIDHGPDCYATQTWAGPTARRTSISWMANWQYAAQAPTPGFRGAMTLPHELVLVQGERGPRLQQAVPSSVGSLFPTLEFTDEGIAVPPGPTYHVALGLQLQADEQVSVALFGEAVPQLIATHRGEETALRYRRAPDADSGLGSVFDRDVVAARVPAPSLRLDIYVDHGLVEVSINDGLAWASVAYFPPDVAGAVKMQRVGQR
jgi:fructan beta-fructosidase